MRSAARLPGAGGAKGPTVLVVGPRSVDARGATSPWRHPEAEAEAGSVGGGTAVDPRFSARLVLHLFPYVG